MSWKTWVRQVHRWLSMAFTAGVIVNTVVIFGLGQKQPAFWAYLLALIPLALLLFAGLHLFVLPYAAAFGRGRQVVRKA